MKDTHEIIQSIGVVISLIVSASSFYFSYSDRLANRENVLITGSYSYDNSYDTTINAAESAVNQEDFWTIGLQFDLRVSNNSNQPVSIVGIATGFWIATSAGKDFLLKDVIRSGQAYGAPLEPVNLSAWQSQVIKVTISYPIEVACRFKDLPLGKKTRVSQLLAIYSSHDRMFPTCRFIDWNPKPRDETTAHQEPLYNGPFFSAVTSTKRSFQSAGDTMGEIYLPRYDKTK